MCHLTWQTNQSDTRRDENHVLGSVLFTKHVASLISSRGFHPSIPAAKISTPAAQHSASKGRSTWVGNADSTSDGFLRDYRIIVIWTLFFGSLINLRESADVLVCWWLCRLLCSVVILFRRWITFQKSRSRNDFVWVGTQDRDIHFQPSMTCIFQLDSINTTIQIKPASHRTAQTDAAALISSLPRTVRFYRQLP